MIWVGDIINNGLCLSNHLCGSSCFGYKDVEWERLFHQLINELSNSGNEGDSNGNHWVVVITVSEWYEDLFLNWYYWYQTLLTDMTVILIAEDEFIFRKYENTTKDLKVISLDISLVRQK